MTSPNTIIADMLADVERLERQRDELLIVTEDLAAKATALENDYINRWGTNEYTFQAHNAGAVARSVISKMKCGAQC